VNYKILSSFLCLFVVKGICIFAFYFAVLVFFVAKNLNRLGGSLALPIGLTMLHLRFASCLLLSTAIGCNATAEQPANAKQWSVVAEEKLTELSGLAPYRGGEETLFWAHNDGSRSKLYLLDQDGDTRATLDIEGIDPVDCEDLCSFQAGESRFLLLADTGDNDLRRKSCKLYLIMEPSLAAFEDAAGKKKKNKDKTPHLKVKPAAIYEFTYPDGAHNCEAVGVDAGRQKILLVTKEKDRACDVYSLPLLIDPWGVLGELPAQPQQATHLARINVPTITGLAVDPSGKRLVLLGRGQLFEFTRPTTTAADASEPFVRMLKAGPRPLAKPKQEQGEAVCFSPDGKKLYVASEGKKQPIWELSLEN
jgi:hypothetical protein